MNVGSWQIFLPIALGFAAVFLLVWGLGRFLTNFGFRRRVASVVAPTRRSSRTAMSLGKAAGRWTRVVDAVSKLSVPSDSGAETEQRLQFIRAGLRNPNAARVFHAVRASMTLGPPLLVWSLLGSIAPETDAAQAALYILLAAVAGYYLPGIWLDSRTSARQAEIRDALPDMIDLLVICAESGLGMDAAINRVSREMARNSKALAEEFYLVALETRAGSTRIAALKNLARRVHLDDLYDLVAMLVQADKFGTSLGESLRIQADIMRTKRMQRAEEAAAKVPAKMLLPLVLFIFPVLMIVLIGPAAIQMMAAMGGD